MTFNMNYFLILPYFSTAKDKKYYSQVGWNVALTTKEEKADISVPQS